MSAGSRTRKVQVSVDEEGVDAIYSLRGDSKDISTQDEAGENQLDDRSVSSRSSGCTESGSIAGYTEREALTAALNAVSIDGLGQIIDAEGDSASILSIGSSCYEAEIIFVDEFLPKSLDADSRIVEEGMVHDRSDMFRPLRVVETQSCECDDEIVQEQTVRIEYRCYDGITVEAVIIESKDELRKKRTSGSYESAPTFDTSQIEKKDSSFDNTIPSPPACDEESVDTPYMTMQNPDERSVLMASGSTNKITEGRDEINNDLEQATNDVEVASNTAPGSEATRLEDIIADKGVATAVSLDEPHGPDSLVQQAASRAEDDGGETSWSDTYQPALNNDLSHAEFVRGDTNEYETGGRSDKENKRIDSDGEVKSNRRGDIAVKGSGSSKVEGREQKERDLQSAEFPVHTKNIDRNHDYVNVVADDDLSACIYEALSCDSFDSEISIGNLDDHVHRILSGLNGTYAGTTSLALN